VRVPALFLLLALGACASLPESAAPLTAGAAVEDITPPVGWRRAGGYHEEISTGVHDPLKAKALALEQGGLRSILVVLDLCSIGKEVSDPLRRRIAERTGVPVPNIVVSATHTHGGPEYYGVLWDVWREATIARHGRDVHLHGDYVGTLIERTVAAAVRADAARRPVRVEHGLAKIAGIPFNRRYLMKDGTAKMNPGKRHPDIVRVLGPVDEDLPVLLFRDAKDGRPLASYASIAMHTAVFGGPRFGADFPAPLEEGLRKAWGPDFVSILAEGAAGDCNHVDVNSERPQPGDTEPARIGAALAAAILRAAPDFKPVAAPRFGAASAIQAVPIRDTTPEEVERAKRVLSLDWVPNPGFLVMVEAYRILWTERLRRRDGAEAKEEIQAFRLGPDAAILTLPHEIFVELGLEIRRRSPFATTVVVSLANDVDFYVPTRKGFAEGGYEATTSPYLPGGGELLVEAAVRLLERLR
jgi:hypothetical protein